MIELELRRVLLRHFFGRIPASEAAAALREELHSADIRRLRGAMPISERRTQILIDCDKRRNAAHRHLDRGELHDALVAVLDVLRLLRRIDDLLESERAIEEAVSQAAELDAAVGTRRLALLPFPRAIRSMVDEARSAMNREECALAIAIASRATAHARSMLDPGPAGKNHEARFRSLHTLLGEESGRCRDLLPEAESEEESVKALAALAGSARLSLALCLASELRIDIAPRTRCVEQLWRMKTAGDAFVAEIVPELQEDVVESSWHVAEVRVNIRILVESAGTLRRESRRFAGLLEQLSPAALRTGED